MLREMGGGLVLVGAASGMKYEAHLEGEICHLALCVALTFSLLPRDAVGQS